MILSFPMHLKYVNAQVEIANSGKRTATLDDILYWQFQFLGTKNSDPKPGKNIIFIKWNAEVTTSSLTLMIYLVLVSWVPFLVYPFSPVPSKIQHALAGYSKFHCFRSLANERTTSFGPGHPATSDSVESAEQ